MTIIPNASASALTWTKSTYSDGGNNCVEVAAGQMAGAMPVRDSKVPAGPAIVVPAGAWSVFVDSLKG
ncbi:DUF397 domain-containing protein [Streptomyces sp. NPDC003027]